MANRHFGNLADVFKHIVLAECLGTLRPGEYWESHAGRALTEESDEIPPARAHGVHMVWRLADTSVALRRSRYLRAIRKAGAAFPESAAAPLRQIPGSALIARRIWGREARRYLLCDTDAESLVNIRQALAGGETRGAEMAADSLECVQEDGVMVLRGAGLLLPEGWAESVLAFLDPYDLEGATDAGITPLELACELANRGIKVLAYYGFGDEAGRRLRHEGMARALNRARLGGRARRFEGSLKTGPEGCPTQWGFGMLGLNLPAEAVEAIELQARALEAAYEGAALAGGSGAWRYASGTL
jgi:hypothetical protein